MSETLRLTRLDKAFLGIIVLLLGLLTFGLLTIEVGSGHPTRTEALVMMLGDGCKQYHVEWGVFPPEDPDGGTSSLLRCLGTSDGRRQAGGVGSAAPRPPIIEFLPVHRGPGGIVDEWGRCIRYANPGRRNKGGVDILSFGANGREDMDLKHPDFDDITNWVRIEE